MNHFNFKRRDYFSGPHFLGSLLIIAGSIALISLLLITNESPLEKVVGIGVGAIILGLVIISSYGGTLIDFNEKRYKKYFSIVGYKTGEWTSLPHIIAVKVISNSHMHTNTPNGISPTFSGKVWDFKMLIYSNAPRPVLSFVYSRKDKVVKNARILASNLEAEYISKID